MTDRLATLVRAIATMMLRECTDCRGTGIVYGVRSPCPTCGDVRSALAAMEEEGTGEVGG